MNSRNYSNLQEMFTTTPIHLLPGRTWSTNPACKRLTWHWSWVLWHCIELHCLLDQSQQSETGMFLCFVCTVLERCTWLLQQQPSCCQCSQGSRSCSKMVRIGIDSALQLICIANRMLVVMHMPMQWVTIPSPSRRVTTEPVHPRLCSIVLSTS